MNREQMLEEALRRAIGLLSIAGSAATIDEMEELRAALSTRPALSDAEIDALRRDAERYRAIRDDDCDPYGICIWDEDGGWAQDARKPDVVDAAIDAALAARGGA